MVASHAEKQCCPPDGKCKHPNDCRRHSLFTRPAAPLPVERTKRLASMLGALQEFAAAASAFHKHVSNENAIRMQDARETMQEAVFQWLEHCGFNETAQGRSIAADAENLADGTTEGLDASD